MIEFYFPQSCGEWMTWFVAWGFVLVGLFYLVFPKTAMRLFWTYPQQESAALLAVVRGNMGGVPLGLGLCYLIFAQPFLAFALFFCAAFAVIGRIVSFVMDKSFSGFNFLSVIVEILFALGSFLYAFGFVA